MVTRHNSFPAWLSGLLPAARVSVPSSDRAVGFTSALLMKASSVWLFCCLPLIEFRSLLTALRLGLQCGESSPIHRSSFPSPTTPAADCCRLLSVDYSTLSRFPPHRAFSDRRQLSRGKLHHLQCTTAASTLRALDGYGLRHLALARPALTPLIRFLFIGSHLCATLPSDLASRQRPCVLLSFTSIRLNAGLAPAQWSSMLGTRYKHLAPLGRSDKQCPVALPT